MDTGAGEYVREVEARFLELEGRGFALSAQDVGRVLAWHADGVPLRLVLAALDDADRRRRAELTVERLTLGRLARSVEAAMKRRGERVHVAAPRSNVETDDWDKLAAALDTVSGPVGASLKAALESARREGGDVWQAAEDIDRLALEALSKSASADELAAIEASLRDEAHASPEARDERRRFLLGRALRQRHGVPEAVAVLLGERP